MARCGCSGTSGCSCVVVGGDGVQVYGSGTGPDPYVIESTSASITGTVTVTDTPSVDMTLGGSGSLSDPYDISAQVTLSIEDLDDAPTGSPDPGDVIIWDGTAWVYGPPSSGGGGATVVTGDGIAGDGSITDPVVLDLTAGNGLVGAGTVTDPLRVRAATWASLPYSEGGQVQDEGLEVYFDSAGELRTPRGVVLWQGQPDLPVDPDQMYDGPMAFSNRGDVVLGSLTDQTYRSLYVMRQSHTNVDDTGLLRLYQTFTDNLATAALKTSMPSARTDPRNEPAKSAILYMRSNGQVFISSDVITEGTQVGRPLPFAVAAGRLDVTTDPGEPSTTVQVTLPTNRFTEPPIASVTTTNSAYIGSLFARSTGTLVLATRSIGTGGATIGLHWHAIQMLATSEVGLLAAPAPAPRVRSAQAAMASTYVTCPTEGCENQGVPIEVLTGVGEDGQPITSTVICGVCGTNITDTLDDSPPPLIGGVHPTEGTTDGGNIITITGSGFETE